MKIFSCENVLEYTSYKKLNLIIQSSIIFILTSKMIAYGKKKSDLQSVNLSKAEGAEERDMSNRRPEAP